MGLGVADFADAINLLESCVHRLALKGKVTHVALLLKNGMRCMWDMYWVIHVLPSLDKLMMKNLLPRFLVKFMSTCFLRGRQALAR